MVVKRWLFLFVAVSIACSPARPGPPKNLPPPETKTALGPGDKLEIEVVGETVNGKELPKEYAVDSEGNLAFPFVKPIKVEGLEPQEVKERVSQALIEAKVWSTPQLNLKVKEYAGKTVIVSGQVGKSGSIPWRQTLTLQQALSEAGWFTPLGDSNHVILTRKTASGRTVTVVVSVEAISEGKQPDIPLQAGDRITVQASVL